jgi:ribA/ribD-fused uncharacterized protein
MKMNEVIGFTKVDLPYGWMGNMAAYPLKYENKVWLTSEALFQALRFDDVEIRELIRNQRSPMGAKMKAKKYKDKMVIVPRSEADLELMKKVIDLKFQQHPALVKMLIKTADKFIYENVGKRRSASGLFWGAIFDAENKMIGQNMLGLILMEKRTSLLKLENL